MSDSDFNLILYFCIGLPSAFLVSYVTRELSAASFIFFMAFIFWPLAYLAIAVFYMINFLDHELPKLFDAIERRFK